MALADLIKKLGTKGAKELGEDYKIWQQALNEAIDDGDKINEIAARDMLKSINQRLKTLAEGGLVPTGKGATTKEGTGATLQDILGQEKAPAEELAEATGRRARAEASQRNYNLGRGEGVIAGEGSSKLVPYKKGMLEPRPDRVEVLEPPKFGTSKDPEIIDVEGFNYNNPLLEAAKPTKVTGNIDTSPGTGPVEIPPNTELAAQIRANRAANRTNKALAGGALLTAGVGSGILLDSAEPGIDTSKMKKDNPELKDIFDLDLTQYPGERITKQGDVKIIERLAGKPKDPIRSNPNIGPFADADKYAKAKGWDTSKGDTTTPPLSEETAPDLSAKVRSGISKINELKLERPNADTSAYEQALGEAAAKEQMAADEFKAAKKRQDWAQVAERLGQALVQYGAARQGMKSGVDLSNVSVPGADWGAMLQGEQDIRDTAFRQAAKQREAAEGLQALRTRAAEREADVANREKLETWQEQNLRERQALEAQQRMAELEARQAAEPSEEDKLAQRLKQEEALLQLRAKYDKDQSPGADKRRAALSELHAAILTKDDKKVDSAFIKAGEFLTPQEMENIGKAGKGYIGPSKKEVVGGLLGGEAAPAPQGNMGAAQTAAQDPRISNYAANNNLSYQDARRILVNRGYTPNEQ